MGDLDAELAAWARPEDMAAPRPSLALPPGQPAADLLGLAAAALAAASTALAAAGRPLPGALLAAEALYAAAQAAPGCYVDALPAVASSLVIALGRLPGSRQRLSSQVILTGAWCTLCTLFTVRQQYFQHVGVQPTMQQAISQTS